MPTVSIAEREFLKFVMNEMPGNKQLRGQYSAKMIETMEEKALISKTKGRWRLTLTGQEALKQRPEIRRAKAHLAEERAPVELQLALPLD